MDHDPTQVEKGLIRCFACGARTADVDGPIHRYLASSPGCWAVFGEVLAREYGDRGYWTSHGLTVDTYALQHPGTPSPQTVGSAAVHLVALCATLDADLDNDAAAVVRSRVKRAIGNDLLWLEPPADMGPVTVVDVAAAADAKEHARRVRAWAESTWAAWAEHHDTVRAWLETLS